MLNSLNRKNKILLTIAVILGVIAVPLTIFQLQKQQEIRQRAAGEQVSLYFATDTNCTNRLNSTNASLPTNQIINLSLCLDASNYLGGISGFNITLSADNNLLLQSAAPGSDANQFGSSPLPQINTQNNNNSLSFTRVKIDSNVIGTPLRLLNFSAATTTGNGSINITTAQIVSLLQEAYLTVARPSLPYALNAIPTATPTPTPSPSPTPTPTPTPVVFACVNQNTGTFRGQYQCSDVVNGITQCADGFSEFALPSPFTKTSCGTQGCCKQNPNPSPTATPVPGVPTATPTPTPVPFACVNQSGQFAGNYQCANIINGSTQCPAGYSQYSLSAPYSSTSCGTGQGCCVQTIVPTATPTPTPSPSPTPAPGDSIIQFASGTTFESMFIDKSGGLLAHKDKDLAFYLYKQTDDPSSDPNGDKAVAKPTLHLTFSNGRLTGPNINFGKIDPGIYKILVKTPGYLRKLANAQATIVAGGSTLSIPVNLDLASGDGDVNNDNVLDINDYNAILSCLGSKKDSSSCNYKTTADLNDDGNIDIIDLNIFLRSLSFTSRKGD